MKNKSLTVVLDSDLRSDQVTDLVRAIALLRGVLIVEVPQEPKPEIMVENQKFYVAPTQDSVLDSRS